MADARAIGIVAASLVAGTIVAVGVVNSPTNDKPRGPSVGLAEPTAEPVGVQVTDIAVQLDKVGREPAVSDQTAPTKAAEPDDEPTAAPPPIRLAARLGEAPESRGPTPLPTPAAQSSPPLIAPPAALEAAAGRPASPPPVTPRQPLGPAPLPAPPTPRMLEPVGDLDAINWSEAPPVEPPSAPRIAIRPDFETQPRRGRLIERLRNGERLINRDREDKEGDSLVDAARQAADGGRWPAPESLLVQLDALTDGAAAEWATATLADLAAVLDTSGPWDPAAGGRVGQLAKRIPQGMGLADSSPDAAFASQTRRAALAAARRVAVWRAAVALSADQDAADPTAGPLQGDTMRLLATLEQFESDPSAVTAGEVAIPLASLQTLGHPAMPTLIKAVQDHYLAPNVRIAVSRSLAERLMPEETVERGPLVETILGRPVRGSRTVRRTTSVVFQPDPRAVNIAIEVEGDVFSRTVTDAGPVSLRGQSHSAFVVRKPVTLTASGLAVGPATAVASNRSRVNSMQTSFDGVPVMGSLVRSIARNQHEDLLPEANREAVQKVMTQARRQTDAESDRKLADLERRIYEQVWLPLERLGLDPQAVAMHTTEEMATIRLRLAGTGQLAGHTPRPRVPAEAMLSVELHESSVNNAIDRLEIAGQRFTLEELFSHVAERLGREPRIPEDLPEGVAVTFERHDPVRVECRDGLIHVAVRVDQIESGRRDWYDVVARVAYRPVTTDNQIMLEREGVVRIGGEGHRGRFEIALRTIFGKIFPKERPIPLVPERITTHPRLADLRGVQAVATDGWLALALGEPRQPASTVRLPDSAARRE